MKSNDSLSDIGEKLLSAKKVALYPHVGIDGDALGSCVALAYALRKKGIEALIFAGEEAPKNIEFIYPGLAEVTEGDVKDADIAVCVDNAEEDRLSWRAETFLAAPFKIAIDHHITGKHYCDLNYIDPNASAAGEIIYKLINIMDIEIDREIGNCLYAAIVMDTGGFQYSNTTADTHRIAAGLYECGTDTEYVIRNLFESDSISKLKLEAMAMESTKMLCDGKMAITYVDSEMLEKSGADLKETGGIISNIKNIDGVEVAIFLKQKEDGAIKVSMRSKEYIDVCKICAEFGGGGHMRASGCSMEGSFEEVSKIITERVEQEWK